MLTLKDYAREAGVSYEAVRQQVKRYKAELKGHIHQQGRTQYLDDEAVAILDRHHPEKPIAIYEAGYDRQLRELQEKNEDLRDALEKVRETLFDTQGRLSLAEGAQAKLEAAETTKAAMEKLAEEYKTIASQREADAERLRAELEEAKRTAAEAERLRQELELRATAAEGKVEAVKDMKWWQRALWKGE